MPGLRVHGSGSRKFLWLGSVALALACSSSKDIDFFEPGEDASGGATGGSSGSSAGTDTGGTSTGGSVAQGGTSGDGSGGSGSEATGGSGDTGGTDAEGGTSTGGASGTGGTDPSGGSAQGGEAGSGAAPMGGSAGTPAGGTGGAGTAGMGGTGTSGAGMGGAAIGGAGTGGAGTGGAGTGGAGMGGAGTGGSGGCVPTVPATERCDGIDNNCTGGVDEGAACPDNCTGATRAGHTYLLCSFEDTSGPMNRVRTWMQALDFCTTRGLGLVALESAEENQFVLAWIEKLKLTDNVWMAANDRDSVLGPSREGTWVWGAANGAVQFWQGDENGMPVMMRYEDWATGEPNNMSNEDCGVFSADHDYAWDDRVCSNTYANFVCESAASITAN